MKMEPARKLAHVVHQHRCLYDKRSRHYKDKNLKENLWNQVAKEVGLDTGSEAEGHWMNLKARYVRQRKVVKNLARSGASAREIQEVSQGMQIYKLLPWLNDFIPTRRPKSNIVKKAKNESRIQSVIKVEHSENSTDDELSLPEKAIKDDNPLTFLEEHLASQNGLFITSLENPHRSTGSLNMGNVTANNNTTMNDNEQHSLKPQMESSKKKKISQVSPKLRQNTEDVRTPGLKLVKESGNPQQNDSKNNKSVIQNQEKIHTDEDELYGALIAAQLRKLSDYQKLQAKHQIDNILFQVQLEGFVERQQAPSLHYVYPQQPSI